MVGARDLNPADLESDALAPRLAAAGMDAGQPAFLTLKGSAIGITPPGDTHGSARRARPSVRQASESPSGPAVVKSQDVV